jgi:membrane protease YdiL (CAAX protease family)
MSSAPVDLIIGVLSLHGVGLVLIYRFAREHGKNWSDAFGFTSRWRGALFWGAFGAIASYAMIWFLQILISVILQRFRVEPHEQTVVDVLRHTTGWTQLIILGIATVLIVPPAEEMLFRGILYPAIKEAGFPRMAWWITSLLFGAIHMNAATFIPLTFLAVILIWLYEETGNLLAPIVTHAGFNAVNFAMLVWQEKFPHSP